MTDIADDNWSERDNRNAENAPLGFPPGLPAQIELIGQMMMGAIKRSWNKENPVYLTSGTLDNYVVTPEGNTAFLNVYEIIRVRIDRTNTTATPTLKFGRTTARTIVKVSTSGIAPLIAGDLLAGQDHSVWFNGTNFILSDPATVDSSVTVGLLKTANNLSELTPTAATARGNIGAAASNNATLTGTVTVTGLTASSAVATDASKNLVSVTNTGNGNNVLATSPALAGNPTSPTQSQGDNSTRIATTAYVDTGLATKLAANGGTILNPSGLLLSGLLYGLTLSNDAGDLTNDIGIAGGSAASDDATPVLMTLASALIKRTDAAWAVGNNAGMWLDGASMPNGTGHVFLIRRPDTGVVDVGASASLSPTLPTNYTQKRRIGSIIRGSGAILAFRQTGDRFMFVTPPTDLSLSVISASALRTLTVPTGLVLRPILNLVLNNTGSTNTAVLLGDAAAGSANLSVQELLVEAGGTQINRTTIELFWTNTTSQLYAAVAGSNPSSFLIRTFGWIDTRGREA
jgi:hypothetical protein